MPPMKPRNYAQATLTMQHTVWWHQLLCT